MITPLEWLTEFLHQRGLTRPDGRRLYAYRLDEQEFKSLRELVGSLLSDKVLDVAAHLAPRTAELFVLYGAAWWQREYAGGAWRWDDVISAFGSSPDRWTPQFRSQCVQVGLQYWGQRIPTSGKKYFGVLVEQGGLPRVLLAQSKGNIYGLIRAVLRRAARLEADIDEIAAMVIDYEEKLPRSLQNETVRLLIAKVVSTVLDLKREFKLVKGDNAVARLEKAEPLWRLRFPVGIDDQAAVSLLSDLVGDAAAIEAETRAAPVIVERLLVQNAGTFELLSRIEFPTMMLGEALARLAGVDESALPFHFGIDLHIDKRYQVADVRKSLGAGQARFQFTVLRAHWRGDAAMREHLLDVSLPGQEQVSSPVPGGMEIDPDSPWVFVSNGDEWRLVAQGGARIRQAEAFVVVNKNWKIETENPESSFIQVGDFASEALSKSVLKVCGVVSVFDGEHTFRMRTGQAGVEAERPVWEGRRFAFASSPSLAFINLPKLCRYTTEGARVVVPAHELEWRVAGTSRVIAADAARGPVDVLWRTNGELRLRTRMVVLDRHPVRFQSGADVTKGQINLPASWAMGAVTALEQPIRLACERNADVLALNVEAIDSPPESVRLTLDWKACPVPCLFTLPFPASGGHFVDGNENRLSEQAAIQRDQLVGVCLRLFDSNPDHPVLYKLTFTLRSKGLDRLSALPPIEHIVELRDHRAEVRLVDHQSDINSLLSQTDALDAVITVALWAGRKPVATLLIKRYEFALVRDGVSVVISSSDLVRLSTVALASIELCAVPIESMHCSGGIKLMQQFSEGVATGRWDLPAHAYDHQWLIYSPPASSHNFRAVIVDLGQAHHGAKLDQGQVTESILDVLQMSDPFERRVALTNRLASLSADYTHQDWEVVEGIWNNLGHLTLPTMDIWRIMALDPVALTAFACRYWEKNALDDVMSMCRRFQSELGVLWETVPLSTWNGACDRLGEQYGKLMPMIDPATRSALIADRIGVTLRALRMNFPAINTLLAFVSFCNTGHEAEVVAPLTRARLQDLKARLWHGSDAAIQNIILRNSRDRNPPASMLMTDILTSLRLPDATADIARALLWDPTNPMAAVANMPVLIALCICTGALNHWWCDPTRLMQLRQYRDFDRDWFSHAFDQAVAMCIAAGVVPLLPMKMNKS